MENNDNIVDQIALLKSLKDRGLITNDQYEKERRILLDSIYQEPEYLESQPTPLETASRKPAPANEAVNNSLDASDKRKGYLFLAAFILILIIWRPGCNDDTSSSLEPPVTNTSAIVEDDENNKMPASPDKSGTNKGLTMGEVVRLRLKADKRTITKQEQKELDSFDESMARLGLPPVGEFVFTNEDFEKNCLSGWDGSFTPLVFFVKKLMNDPDSYEHVETRFSVVKDKVYISMKYRGKNAFNATITTYIKATANTQCHLLSVEGYN